jgi:hypothetical protein
MMSVVRRLRCADAMGWTDAHLREFEFVDPRGRLERIGIPPDDLDDIRPTCWSKTRRSTRPRSSASPTPTPGPAAESARPSAAPSSTEATWRASPAACGNCPPARPPSGSTTSPNTPAGRPAAGSAKALDAEAVNLTVAAHVRHHETDYDALLASGLGRHEARAQVAPRVREVMRLWQSE